MAFAATPPFVSPPIDERGRYAFTVEDYHQLVASGNIARSDRIELINGELTIMPLIKPEHSFHTTRLLSVLPRRLPGGVLLQLHEPITIAPHSEPQPDAAIVKERADGYRKAHPGPKDVLLVIEVADSSVAFDTVVKAKLYGKAGIPEYWVIDVQEACLRVFTEPSSRGYKKAVEMEKHETVKCGSVPGLALKVKELLGGK
jgi:MEMO1 family protein